MKGGAQRGPARRGYRWKACASAVGLLVVTVLLAGCRTSGLYFVKTQLRILSPQDSSTVTLPLRITWTAGNLYRPGDRFAVFLDSNNMIKVGQNISALLPQSCRVLVTCSHTSYLQQANVWLTSKPTLVLPTLPRTSLTDQSVGKEYHTATVIILSASGVRIGEEFATTNFVYIRQAV